MVEILENFESTMSGAERLSPAVLILPGVAAVIVGLFVWLGGLGLKKWLAAIAGAIGGGIICSFAISRSALPIAACAVLAAIVAMLFEKVFTMAFAAGFMTGTGIAFFIGPYVEASVAAEPGGQGVAAAEVTTLTVGQSIGKVKIWAAEASGAIRAACSQMPAHKWAIAVVSGLILAVIGSFLWRPTAALYFSAAGTTLVFAGMILLLFYKGVMPVSRICRRPSIYAGVFATMVVFGMSEQLLLCRGSRTQPAGKETRRNSDKGR